MSESEFTDTESEEESVLPSELESSEFGFGGEEPEANEEKSAVIWRGIVQDEMNLGIGRIRRKLKRN